jgi:hypothetical protein
VTVYRQRRRDKHGNPVFASEIVRRIPTQDELKARYHYDPETGVFTHLESRGKGRAGQTAGAVDRFGYVEMRFCNRLFKAHQLAHLYMTGEFVQKPYSIDHINGVRDDNRWVNLRVADYHQQVWNSPAHRHNQTGLKGAWPCKTTGRWVSMLQDGQRRIWLGRYDTAEAAHKAWIKIATELRGPEWVQRAMEKRL